MLTISQNFQNANYNSNQNPAIRAYLGGSFNPVHNGHLQMAMAVFDQLKPIANRENRKLTVELLPNARSPFKADTIAPKHRLAMLKLAVQNTPLGVSELEIWQPPPVFTIDTVRQLRQQFPKDTLIFIMGMDSAVSLDKWRQGLELTDFVHLWVFDRAADEALNVLTTIETQIAKFPNALQAKVTTDLLALTNPAPDLFTNFNQQTFTLLKNRATNQTFYPLKPLKININGRIYLDSTPIITISSSTIRKRFADANLTQNFSPNDFNLLNPLVYGYIIRHQLYSDPNFR